MESIFEIFKIFELFDISPNPARRWFWRRPEGQKHLAQPLPGERGILVINFSNSIIFFLKVIHGIQDWMCIGSEDYNLVTVKEKISKKQNILLASDCAQ